ncbi:MAG TPA: RNA 2'-phosphotransferase [Acidimicrobiia bacterium]|nr:RNA 2'-phosphotransferase [Acidimicrobiia bacterium]
MRRAVRISKFLALVLRHDPDRIGLRLDSEGWADVDELLAGAARAGLPISRAELGEVVRTNPKQRFTLDATANRIRANQGHSLEVDLGLTPVEPPPHLYHGTSRTVVPVILAEGLRPMGRRQVHLSPDAETALAVGARHGPPVALVVDSGRMHAEGYRFYRSVNGVWLTDLVPPVYLREQTRQDVVDG